LSAQRRAAVRECLLRSTVCVGGGRSPLTLGESTRMTTIVILFVAGQLVGPVLLIRFFKWRGILGAFAFTAALHYGFHKIWVAHDSEAATAYNAAAFSFAMAALGFVYCLISIAIAGAFSRREEPAT